MGIDTRISTVKAAMNYEQYKRERTEAEYLARRKMEIEALKAANAYPVALIGTGYTIGTPSAKEQAPDKKLLLLLTDI